MSRHEHLDWVQPQWWVGQPLTKYEDAEVFISRDQLITAWAAATASPKPNVKLLNDQLKSWCSELGGRRWVYEPYGQNGTEVARRLVKGPKQILQQPEIWDQVCAVLADYGDPLARRSAQYDGIIGAHRPIGLPQKFARLRGWERNQVCRAAREAMVTSCSVLETKESAEQFIDNPTLFGEIIESTAGREYNMQLIDFLSEVGAAEGLTEKENDALDLLWTVSEDLTAKYGEPDALPRDPTAEEVREVDDQLQEFLNRRPEIYRGDDFQLRGHGRRLSGLTTTDIAESDAVAIAWDATRENLLKFKVKGTPITDDWMGRIFTTKLRDAIKDLRRRAIRHNNRVVLESSVVDPDDGNATLSSLDVETVDSETERQRIDLQGLLASAHKALTKRNVEKLDAVGDTNQLDGQQSWEKSTALAILSSDALALSDRNLSNVSGLFESGGLRSTLNRLIVATEPDNRLLANPDNSVRLVIALLQWAVARVIDDDDIPAIGILGGKNRNETWSEKMHRLVTDVRTTREISNSAVWGEK